MKHKSQGYCFNGMACQSIEIRLDKQVSYCANWGCLTKTSINILYHVYLLAISSLLIAFYIFSCEIEKTLRLHTPLLGFQLHYIRRE